MTASTTRAELPNLLVRVAAACKDAVAVHFAEREPDLRFQRQVLFSLAAMESAAARSDLENADIRLVRDAAADGAAVARTERPDDAMRTVVACFEDVVAACERILAEEERRDELLRWQRFRFADADITVARADRLWHVATTTARTTDTLLDVALERLLPLASHRLGELTVQILDWFEHDDGADRA